MPRSDAYIVFKESAFNIQFRTSRALWLVLYVMHTNNDRKVSDKHLTNCKAGFFY